MKGHSLAWWVFRWILCLFNLALAGPSTPTAMADAQTSGTNQIAAWIEQQDLVTGYVRINGVGIPLATEPEWDFGDGATFVSWFPASHTYAAPRSNYVVRVIGRFTDGTTATATVLVRFAPTPDANELRTEINVDGTLTVYEGTQCPSGALVIPETIEGRKVSAIGNSAFEDCSTLTSIKIPSGIISIGNSAFQNCTNLIALTLPDTLIRIGALAFADCTSLEAIAVDPRNRSYIAVDGVLFDSRRTTLLAYPGGKSGSYEIPEGIRTVGYGAFWGCAGLVNIDIPNSVAYLGQFAFAGCSRLTNATIPTLVTEIPYATFGGCTSLKTVTIPEGVVRVDDFAFSECRSLKAVTIPSSVARLGLAAFGGCTNLGEAYFQGDAPKVLEDQPPFGHPTSIYYFAGTLGWGTTFSGRPTLQRLPDRAFATNPDGTLTIIAGCAQGALSIPDTVDGRTVTRIGDGAFSDCVTLTSVTLPASILSIGDGAFRGCDLLREAHFSGNAPDIAQGQPFDSPTTIYYRPGMAGWGPLFSGRPTAERWPDDAFAVDTDGTVTIVRGACPTGAVTIPEVIEGRKVTSIGFRAFFRCTGLTNVTIGNGVTHIGFDAFHGCTGLTSIAIPNSVTTIEQQAFFGCAGLSSITLPEGITTIGSQAFTECSSLRSITIPGSAANMSPGAFFYCQGLTNVMIGDGVPSIAQGLFGGCTQLIRVTIPGSVTNIGSWAFNDCRSLTSVTIPDSVNSIGEYAFCNCGSLTSIVIPDRATGIGTKTFWSCSQMTDCTIGNGVTTIGDEAFAGCSSLATITLPAGVTNIGQGAFAYCSSLESATMADSVISIGDRGFLGCASLANIAIGNGVVTVGDAAFSGCLRLARVTIGPKTLRFGSAPFAGCTNMFEIQVDAENPAYESINGVLLDKPRSSLLWFPPARAGHYAIPPGVTNVVDRAFSQSQGLTGVDFPDSVTVIGDGAFEDCTSLGTVTIGSGVTTIGYRAFAGCTNLNKVTIPASVTSIKCGAFAACGDSLDAYFEGRAPGDVVYSWDYCYPGRVFYGTVSYHYLPGNDWWDSGDDFGTKSTVWRPQVTAGEDGWGPEADRTAITVSWARGRTIVIEANADLANPTWTPISTNALVDGWVQFTDPDGKRNPARFYRVRGE